MASTVAAPRAGDRGRIFCAPFFWRATRLCGYSCVGLVALLALLLGGLWAGLAQGPIRLDRLAPTIVKSLDEQYAGRFSFGLNTVAIATTSHGPTLTVEGLTVKARDHVVVAAPRAELSVDPTALLMGRVKPRRLEAQDLELRLAVSAEGQVSISAGAAATNDALPIGLAPASPPPSTAPATSPPQAAADAQRLLARGGGALRALLDLVTNPDSAIGAIDRVGLTHGRLVIDDRALDRIITYDDLTLRLDKGAGGMTFKLAASGPARRWSVTARASGTPGARRVFEAAAQDVSLDEIALLGGMREAPFDTDAPLSLTTHFALDPSDRVIEASGAARVGAGFFRLNEPDHEPVMIQEVSGAAAWDKPRRRFVVTPIVVKTGSFDAALEGDVTPPAYVAPVAGAPETAEAQQYDWAASLHLAKPTSVGPERAGQAPLQIDHWSARARLSPEQKKFVIEEFDLRAPRANIQGSASIDWVDGGHIGFGLSAENTHIEALTRLLPTHVASPVRNWLFEHAPLGVLRKGGFTASYTQADMLAMRYENPPPDSAIHGEADIVDATLLELLPGFPPVSNLAGHLKITGRSVTIDGASATIQTAHDRRLALTEARFVVDDTALKPAPASLELHLAGGVDTVAEVLATPSLAPYTAMPLDSTLVKGQIDGRVHALFDVGDGARGDRTAVSFDANASNVSIERFLGAERLEGGLINIVGDRSGLRATGSGRVYGGATTLDIRRGADDKTMQAQIQLIFDEGARARAGFPLPGVTGPIVAHVKTQLPVSDAETPVELDLSRAALDNVLPGVSKPAGKPAKAQFAIAKRADGVTLDHFMLEAGASQLAGVVDLGRDGAFRSAKFSQFRLSLGDDAKVEAQRGADALKISVRGVNIDARPMLRAMVTSGHEHDAASGSGRGPISFDDLDLDLKSPIVSGHGKQILSNVELKWERRGGKPQNFALTGHFGRAPLAATLTRGPTGVMRMEVGCGDGGALLSFFDIYGRMESGAFDATIDVEPGHFDGVMHASDFFLRNEPAMRQLMTHGAHRADEAGVWKFDPDSVRVARLQSQFTWSDGRLALREGVMSGPEVGLTFAGFVDFPREQLDLNGAYVPMYGLNNLVGNIPVLGELLAGGAHEGIIAMNYAAVGSTRAPTVKLSPMSALTPGVFRKIIGVMDGTARSLDRVR